MSTILRQVKATIPNYRVIKADVDLRTLKIKVTPKGARGVWPLRWWPYWSGSKVAITINVEELKRKGAANELIYELHSDVELRELGRRVTGKVCEFPLRVESPWEYVSAPDEYRYEFWIGGQHWTVADFSAYSKDRVILTVGVTLFGVLLAGLISLLLR